jgi:predicted CoA-substrate-specific enzyme activase
MITAGVDAGLRNTKVVILSDGKVLARGEGFSGGGNRDKVIEEVYAKALEGAGLSADDVITVVATGQGKNDVSFADKKVVEAVADARLARFLYPKAKTVVDVGADQTRVITLGENDGIQEVVLNQKCMAGLGLLIEVIADRLGLTLEEISKVEYKPGSGEKVNDGCPVFAEQGALELLNNGVSKEEIVSAVDNTVVVRLNAILNDKIRPEKDTTVLIGGITRNRAIVNGIKDRSGIDFLIPEEAAYGGAFGAAVIATDYPVAE